MHWLLQALDSMVAALAEDVVLEALTEREAARQAETERESAIVQIHEQMVAEMVRRNQYAINTDCQRFSSSWWRRWCVAGKTGWGAAWLRGMGRDGDGIG